MPSVDRNCTPYTFAILDLSDGALGLGRRRHSDWVYMCDPEDELSVREGICLKDVHPGSTDCSCNCLCFTTYTQALGSCSCSNIAVKQMASQATRTGYWSCWLLSLEASIAYRNGAAGYMPSSQQWQS